MNRTIFQKEIPLKYEVDVFIAGGGPAGCAAAVSAARMGESVLLVENQGCLGGMGTAGLVPGFMTFVDGEHFLVGDFGKEVLQRMWDHEKATHSVKNPMAIDVEALKRTYDDLLTEAGADFLLCTQVIDVKMTGEKIDYCVLAAKSGIFAIKAKVYIDCTGDGDLAACSGAPYQKGDENGKMMAGTLCSMWTGMDWSKVLTSQDEHIKEACDDGVFSKPDYHLPGMWMVSDLYGPCNAGHAFGVDGTDERSLTEALVNSRKLYLEYNEYYRKYVDGFQKAQMVATASMMGIRETRRIEGEYTLTIEDFVNRAVFDDEIGRYSYQVDLHASDNSKEAYEKFDDEYNRYVYKKGESYGIPYRILLPKNVDNLLVAGRCVSTDRLMQSSLRVMPGCFITGQAAGMAAAMSSNSNISPRQINVKVLQSKLLDAGVYLPNC